MPVLLTVCMRRPRHSNLSMILREWGRASRCWWGWESPARQLHGLSRQAAPVLGPRSAAGGQGQRALEASSIPLAGWVRVRTDRMCTAFMSFARYPSDSSTKGSCLLGVPQTHVRNLDASTWAAEPAHLHASDPRASKREIRVSRVHQRCKRLAARPYCSPGAAPPARTPGAASAARRPQVRSGRPHSPSLKPAALPRTTGFLVAPKASQP